MSLEIRKEAVLEAIKPDTRVIEFPRHDDGRPRYPSEFFGESVFTLKDMAKALPKPIFASFMRQRRGRFSLDKSTADAIAHAVRIWAMDRGATHFTHWFQPQTGTTAQKHDAFLSLITNFTPGGEEVAAIDMFSGQELLQSEPDASSFPSGGMRSTFEARGYTVWDTSNNMFIQPGPNHTTVLYIPSIFISYNGEALDEKTGLLRSTESISNAATETLNLLEPDSHVSRVYTTLGTEQEFFLVDRSLYSLRPDLKITGRTLMGKLPPRHQQLEDHYFGQVPSRVLRIMSELELECTRLGIPLKTRHNEVAPAQFEVAPIFEEASVASDHNLLTMDVLHQVAHRHNMRVLYHEKPYDGVNGSGKHCNWSMQTDHGENLLNPSVRPETNYRFLIFLLATLRAVEQYSGLLAASIASSTNERRLGGNEAPPTIISVFLGDQLNEVLDAIEEDRPLKNFSVPQFQRIKVGGTVLDVKVAALPTIKRDLTDRNRTSPFAFTGNRFEFRAVGSKQSPAFPMTILNAAVTSALREINKDLIELKGDKPRVTTEDKLTLIRKYIKLTKRIRFEGDGYTEAWAKESNRRGLPQFSTPPDAYEQLRDPANIEMLVDNIHIFTRNELESRRRIMCERYAKDLTIEAQTMKTMVQQQVLPAILEYKKSIAEGAKTLRDIGEDASVEMDLLGQLGDLTKELNTSLKSLYGNMETVNRRSNEVKDDSEKASIARELLFDTMNKLREKADALEGLVADKVWPLPNYGELLLTM